MKTDLYSRMDDIKSQIYVMITKQGIIKTEQAYI